MLHTTDSAADRVKRLRNHFAALADGWRAISAASAEQARGEAEVLIFNQMVVALQAAVGEGPVGTPAATEVRLLAEGVQTDGRFPHDGIARWRPDASVTGYRPGDRIALTEDVFSRLADVYLGGLARAAT